MTPSAKPFSGTDTPRRYEFRALHCDLPLSSEAFTPLVHRYPPSSTQLCGKVLKCFDQSKAGAPEAHDRDVLWCHSLSGARPPRRLPVLID